MKVVPFKPRLAPYRQNPANGQCYAIKSHRVEYDYGGREIVVGADFAFIHMSASGNSAGGYGGFANLLEAERAAWREARRLNAIFIPSTVEERRWTKPSDNLVSLIPPRDPGNGGSAA